MMTYIVTPWTALNTSAWAVMIGNSAKPSKGCSCSCVAVRPALTSTQLLASQVYTDEHREAAATSQSWRVRYSVPDRNCCSKVRNRWGLGLYPFFLAVNVFPGLGNPKLFTPGRLVGHSAFALLLGDSLNYLLLATAEEETGLSGLWCVPGVSSLMSLKLTWPTCDKTA